MGFKNAVWDLLKYTHGGILTTTFAEDGVIFADGEKLKIDWYGPLTLDSVYVLCGGFFL